MAHNYTCINKSVYSEFLCCIPRLISAVPPTPDILRNQVLLSTINRDKKSRGVSLTSALHFYLWLKPLWKKKRNKPW